MACSAWRCMPRRGSSPGTGKPEQLLRLDRADHQDGTGAQPAVACSRCGCPWLKVPPGRRGARRAPRPARLLPARTPPSTRWRPPWRRASGLCRVGGRRRCRSRRRVPAQLGDGGDDFGELVRVFEVDRNEAVVPGGTAQRFDVSAESRGPHRHPGPLNRSGEELDTVDGVVLAAVVHRLTGPGGGEDLQCLVEHLASKPAIELLAGLGQLAAEAVASETDAKGGAATAEPVQRRRFPGNLGRPAAARGVTMGPSRRCSVAVAIAASVIHGSATCRTGARHRRWSQTNTPCQPASSASAARRATTAGSARLSKSGSQSAERSPVVAGRLRCAGRSKARR